MVLHGYVYYTGQPVNLYYDTTEQMLKQIEYGYLPYYELTYSRSSLLANTPYSQLFTSHFAQWQQNVTETYEELNRELAGSWTQPMVSHEQLEDGFVRVEYADGTIIYVNYNSRECRADGVTVPAEDYLVKAGGSK